MMDATLREWAGLPLHIVDILVFKLDRFFDYVRFCGVCQEWRYVALEANVVHKANLDILKASRKKLPMLVLFKTDENNDERRSLFNVIDKTTFYVKLLFSYKYRFVGSSCGWLFCLSENMVVTLVNPINNSCISLPSITDPIQYLKKRWRKLYFDHFIRKGILLSDPGGNPSSFGVVVIYGGEDKLAFARSGESSWSFINPKDFFFSDIIHYQGKLYGVEFDSEFVEIDFFSRTIKTIVPEFHDDADFVYLVESQDGELLMVRRKWFGDFVDKKWFGDFGDNTNEYNNGVDYPNNVPLNDDQLDVDHLDDDHLDGKNRTSDSEASDALPYLYPEDDDNYPRSFEFKVFKMTHLIEEGSATWVEIDNIGQQALFLGDNHSVSVSTAEFPGCLPNSIYYITQHHKPQWHYVYRGETEDSGVYDIENKRFYRHHVLSEKYMQPTAVNLVSTKSARNQLGLSF